MENRKRNIQMKFYVTEEEKRLIDEKMKQLPIKQYGAYFRKMAIDGYILVVDRSDTKAYIRELQAVSRNINQIAKRANATGTVYRQDIEDMCSIFPIPAQGNIPAPPGCGRWKKPIPLRSQPCWKTVMK